MRFKTLSEWLSWQETLHPKSIELGLSRVRQVADQLGLLDPAVPVITVGGTNGKGSCVRVLEQLFLDAGLTPGCYTSPHLHHYCERITIAGNPVSEADVIAAFASIDDARGDVSLTYFEFGTLAALLLFKQMNVDVQILEVGLGGRLDAVNIVDADIAIVTTVDLDHQDWLGASREDIGYEKAGIFRADHIAICADESPPLSLLNYADKIGAHLRILNRHFGWFVASDEPGLTSELVASAWSLSALTDDQGNAIQEFILSDLPTLPPHSVIAALDALHCLANINHAGRKFNAPLNLSSLKKEWFFDTTNWQLSGRFEAFSSRGLSGWLDVAHNPAAAVRLADLIKASGAMPVAVLGIMSDKDIAVVLKPLIPVVTHWHLCNIPGVSRAASAELISHSLLALGVDDFTFHSSPAAALSAIASAVESQPTRLSPPFSSAPSVVVLGSFYTVAAAHEWLQEEVTCASD